MFSIGKYRIFFNHHDEGKGIKRKRIITCSIVEIKTDVLMGIGRAQYNEGDVYINLPYDKGFGRRLALKRALGSLGDLDEFNKEFHKEVWSKYFSMVSAKERSIVK